MKKLTFGSLTAQDTFDQYFCHMLEMDARLDRIEEKIIAIAQNERFLSAGSFMAYLGLVPSEHSSGTKRHQGGITKTGNSHLRKLLIEASWHYRHRFPANTAFCSAARRLEER